MFPISKRKKSFDWWNGGDGILSPPTEAELFAYIPSLSPKLWIRGESGITDISGNAVPLTFNGGTGTPTIVTNQLDGKSIIRFDGTNDAMFWPRINFKTVFLVFKESATGTTTKFIWMNPDSNAGLQVAQGMWKKQDAALTLYTALYIWNTYPASDGRLVSEFNTCGSSFQSFCTRGDDTFKASGKGIIRQKATNTIGDATSTYAIMGCNGKGDKSSLSLFTSMDVAEFIGFDVELTDDQVYIVQAYLERSYPSLYPKTTFLYKSPVVTQEATNPVIAGNPNEDTPSNYQSYPPFVYYSSALLPNQYVFYKTSLKKSAYSVSTDGIAFTPGPLTALFGPGGSFNENGSNSFEPFEYNGIHYALVTGIMASGQYQIGWMSCSTLTGVYTNVSNSPLISNATINAALGKSYTNAHAFCLTYTGGTYYMFVCCSVDGAGTLEPGELVLITTTDWSSFNIVGVVIDKTYGPLKEGGVTSWSNNNIEQSLGGFCDARWVAAASVVFDVTTNKWAMFLEYGNRDNQSIVRTKICIQAVSDDLTGPWKMLGGPLMVNLATPAWDDAMIYGPKIVYEQGDMAHAVKIDGKYRVYHAGASLLGSGGAAGEHGQTGLAYMDTIVNVVSLP